MNRLHDTDLDRLFAEKLDDLRVEPPERSWKKVAAGIAITTTVSTTVLSNFIRPVIWSLSTIATVFLVSVTNPSSNTEFAAKPVVANTQPAIRFEFDRIFPLMTAEEIPVIYTEEAPQLIPVIIPINDIELNIAENEDLPVSVELTAALFENPDYLKKLTTTQLDVPQLSWSAQLLSAPNLLQQEKNIVPAWFELSYQTGPDIFDFGTRDESRITSIALNNGVDVSFHFSEFYLRTGVNSINMIQRNVYNYSINEYKKIGDYTMVDSMWFQQSVDTAGNIIVTPQYITSSHAVFDSVAVEHTTTASDRYQYLEIPMALGFQKDIHRFSLYAQAGFTYTFLLKSSEKTQAAFAEETGSQPLSWQTQSLSRNKDFWSFTLAGGVLYNTNTRLSFGIEPTYRYGLSPFYAGDERLGKAPVSYGVKLRLVYKLSY